MISDYVRIKKEELKDLLSIVIILSLLFSLTYVRFSSTNVSLFAAYIYFFLFLFFLLSTRLLFMKLIAYKNGFEIFMKMTYFDVYFLRNYDKISYTAENVQSKVGVKSPRKIKGIPLPLLALFIYIFTLGIIIFPSQWLYHHKKIPHKFLGSKQFYESSDYFDVTEYRYSKVLFAGFFYYFIFGFFLKAFFSSINVSFYNWFVYSLYWIAFVTIIPIMGTEGFELFSKHNFMWINVLTILILGMLALLVFKSMAYVIGITVISFIMVFIVILWRQLMDGGH